MTSVDAKRSYNELSNDKKLELIQDKKNKKSNAYIISKYNVCKSSISNIVKSEASIRANSEKSYEPGTVIRNTKANKFIQSINEAVIKLISRYNACNIPVMGFVITNFALIVAETLGCAFKASKGWLYNLCKKNKLKSKKNHGQSAGVDLSAVEEWKKKIPTITNNYNIKDIFNCDESALYYRTLPAKTYVKKGSDQHGFIQSKERISILFAANALGERLKPLVIHKAQYPVAFKKAKVDVDKLPVAWKTQPNSWMTRAIFCAWLEDLNNQFRKQNRKILMFCDNAAVHDIDKTFSHVKLVFLPPNLTSHTQPMDAGIISSVKAKYRRIMLQRLYDDQDRITSITAYLKLITVYDAVLWIARAWAEVSDVVFKNCFRKAYFPVENQPAPTVISMEGCTQQQMQANTESSSMPADEQSSHHAGLNTDQVITTTMDGDADDDRMDGDDAVAEEGFDDQQPDEDTLAEEFVITNTPALLPQEEEFQEDMKAINQIISELAALDLTMDTSCILNMDSIIESENMLGQTKEEINKEILQELQIEMSRQGDGIQDSLNDEASIGDEIEEEPLSMAETSQLLNKLIKRSIALHFPEDLPVLQKLQSKVDKRTISLRTHQVSIDDFWSVKNE